MTANERFDDSISAWLQEAAPTQLPLRVLTATFEQTRRARQKRSLRWPAIPVPRSRFALAAASTAIVAIAVAGSFGLSLLLNQQIPATTPTPASRTDDPSTPPGPTVDLGIFDPIAGWVVYGNAAGIWGDNPDGNDVKLPVAAGEPIAWSRDGTQLLLVRERNLFNLRADGSEIQLTSNSLGADSAIFSRDGSRVLFQAASDGPGGLFAVDADGGTADYLGEAAERYMAFSPDGDRVAYATWGRGDSEHTVWVMNADGSNRHLIVANDVTLRAGHLHGIAWSPAGDRIVLGLEGNFYTFAPDGSGFRLEFQNSGTERPTPFWTPDGSRLETVGPRHPGRSVGPLPAPTPTPQPTVAPSLEAGVAELLNAFLAARIAGAGAEQYVSKPADIIFGDVPLLYETSANAAFDRGEFEQVLGVAWPYEFTGFKVRLFAGPTLVEQLVFVTREAGRLVIEYVPDGFGTAIAPTTENGIPVARPYVAFGGEVTMEVAHPWVFHYDGGPIKLPPAGATPTTDGGERNDWVELRLVADPSPIGTTCQANATACDALAIAEGIRSNYLVESTVPEPFAFSGASGVYMEVAGRSVLGLSVGSDQRMALYIYDAPVGSSMRILVLAVVVHASEFEHAGIALGPVPYSIEFHGQGGTQ